jgi:hypothetical protein
MDIFTQPTDYGGERLGQPIDLAVIEDLHSTLSSTCEEALRWVDEPFDKAAHDIYLCFGEPELSLETGWKVFSKMSDLLQ